MKLLKTKQSGHKVHINDEGSVLSRRHGNHHNIDYGDEDESYDESDAINSDDDHIGGSGGGGGRYASSSLIGPLSSPRDRSDSDDEEVF